MILYHYCSVEKFKQILSSKVIWLSDLTKSNDKNEVIQTFGVLWSAVKERLLYCDLDKDIVMQEIEALDKQFDLELLVDAPYGCCFCIGGDELQQWQEYGDRTKGVVLGFDFDWFIGLHQHMPHPSVNIENAIGYNAVLYQNQEIEDNFYKACYDAIKEYGLSAWIYTIRTTFKHYSAFIKNPSNYGEYETRIVYYPCEKHDLENNSLRIIGPIEKPIKHYCLPWTRVDGDNALSQIGLGCNSNLSPDDVKQLLNNAGLSGHFGIFNSNCSYRLRD